MRVLFATVFILLASVVIAAMQATYTGPFSQTYTTTSTGTVSCTLPSSETLDCTLSAPLQKNAAIQLGPLSSGSPQSGGGAAPAVTQLNCNVQFPITNGTTVNQTAGGACGFVATCGGVACAGSNAITSWTISSQSCASCYSIMSAGLLQGGSNAANVLSDSTSTVTVTAANTTGTSPGVVQTITIAADPGPSQALFTTPYYTCNTNYYVSTTGSDSNNGTSLVQAWLTLAHAATSVTNATGPGSWCINIAPGRYSAGAITGNGGTTASSTGYIVWRCTTLDACTITDAGNKGSGAMSVKADATSPANYIMFDGFTLNSANSRQATFGIGYGTVSSGATDTYCCHHIWFLNSIVSGYGQGGIQVAEADFVYSIHNHLFNNASATNCDSNAQGSGISIVIPWPIPGTYTLTADDKSNSVVGNMLAPNGTGQYFQQVTMWNISNNNYITPGCAGSITDGNGIIMDTWNSINGSGLVYAHQGLIAFNVTYNNGGPGLKITAQDGGSGTAGVGIVVANNTSYNDGLNTAQCALTEAGGNANLWISNAVYYVAGSACDANGSALGGSSVTTWSNNVAICPNGTGCTTDSTGTNPPMYHGADWLTTNKSNTSPSWNSVGGIGGGSAGSVTTSPSATNFGLQSGSAAISYGLSKTYLPAASVDAGACYHSVATCP